MLLCETCKAIKPFEFFYAQPNTKRGYRKDCKECQTLKSREYYLKNKEHKQKYATENKEKISARLKKWREEHKEEIKDLNKKYREEHKEEIKDLNKKWREEHKEEIEIYQKEYRQEHKEEAIKYRKEYYKNNKTKMLEISKKYRLKNKKKLNEYRKKYYRDVLKNDINFRIKSNLRRRLHAVMLGQEKHKKTLDLLGIGIVEFRKYIESKWLEGMSWDNYGTNGWHIDHIIPLSHFNLQNKVELEKACYYTNMQPLWEGDNCSKGDRYIG